MHTVSGFALRTVMGQSVLVAVGANLVDFNKIISFNPSAALLWQAIQGKEFTNQDLADILVNEYGIDAETALADASEISAKWIENGIATL